MCVVHAVSVIATSRNTFLPLSLFPHLHTPFPLPGVFSLSLISLMAYVDNLKQFDDIPLGRKTPTYLLTSGGVYVPCIYTMPGESYRRQLGSLLLRLF